MLHELSIKPKQFRFKMLKFPLEVANCNCIRVKFRQKFLVSLDYIIFSIKTGANHNDNRSHC